MSDNGSVDAPPAERPQISYPKDQHGNRVYRFFPPHGLARRYLHGHKGIEIGASANNSFYLPDCLNVDYTDEYTGFKEAEEFLCGQFCTVDVVAEMDDLPFEESCQDFVLSAHVLEHAADAIGTVNEWVRVTKPGGLLFIILPQPDEHPADRGRKETELDHFQEDFDEQQTVETHPVANGHIPRGHYHVFSYSSAKAFFKRFFPDTLQWIDGEPVDTKVGNGHTHVLRVIKQSDKPRNDIQPLRKRLWINWPDACGCTYYRQGLPILQLGAELAEIGIDVHSGGICGGVNPDSSFDAYFMQRSMGPGVLVPVTWLKKSKRLLIWDVDDDFFKIPEWSPAHKTMLEGGFLETLPVFLELADFITVTNQQLADRLIEDFDQLAGRVHILPNLIDPQAYQPDLWRRPNRVPRIVWTGSFFHGADLQLLIPVVERLVNETDWEMIFLGDMPVELRKYPQDRVWQMFGTDIRFYARMLCEISPDVALIPITGTLFDRSKSAIKWMECTMAGASVVASDFGPYREAIDHGTTGLLVENETDAWFEAIQTALDNRDRLNANARREVLAKHSWQSPARQIWKDFFCMIGDSIVFQPDGV